jgi:hypothetical protein
MPDREWLADRASSRGRLLAERSVPRGTAILLMGWCRSARHRGALGQGDD